MPTLICTVRGCALPLASRDARLGCARGHSYDVARSGYVNLLQPQDRRSSRPGDSAETVRARRRFHDTGAEEWLVEELLAEVDRLFPRSIGRAPDLLDVGCGDGYVPGELSRRRTLGAHGVDISRPAVELAARRYPGPTWVVGNADRLLPWAQASFDLVTSITARRNPAEIRRVLKPDGVAVFVLPADDDLAELRESLLGSASRRDRAPRLLDELHASLDFMSSRRVSHRARLGPAALRDLLAATYRARASRRERILELSDMELTMSRELIVFRPAAR